MISSYSWDCPKCSKAKKPLLNTVTEFFHPDIDFEHQTRVYSCNRCGWAYKIIYKYKTKRTEGYEITFDKNNDVRLTPVKEYL